MDGVLRGKKEGGKKKWSGSVLTVLQHPRESSVGAGKTAGSGGRGEGKEISERQPKVSHERVFFFAVHQQTTLSQTGGSKKDVGRCERKRGKLRAQVWG